MIRSINELDPTLPSQQTRLESRLTMPQIINHSPLNNVSVLERVHAFDSSDSNLESMWFITIVIIKSTNEQDWCFNSGIIMTQVVFGTIVVQQNN